MELELLPKDVVGEVLLRMEPREIRILCNSESLNPNSKIRRVCQDIYFLERYKQKHNLENNFTIIPFEIESLPKEVLFNLLLQVEPNEIGIVCRGAKNPKIRKICESEHFKNIYSEKYKDFPKHIGVGFSKAVFLKKPLLNFLLNANFGKYNEKIHSLIDPLLKEGILTLGIISFLFTIYLKIHNLKLLGNLQGYKVDETMNFYLDEYLTKLENMAGEKKFNRHNFLFNKIQNIIVLGIIRNNEDLSYYQKKNLKSKTIKKLLEKASVELGDIKYK